MNIFDLLKNKGTKKEITSAPIDIYIQLSFLENEASIRVIDKKQNEVETDHRSYQGHLRDTLKAIETIKSQNDFVIDWEFSDPSIYLSKHEYLIWMIKKLDCLVDIKMNPIIFNDNPAKLILQIEKSDEIRTRCRILLQENGKAVDDSNGFSFINENHILINNTIYEIQPIGEHFNALQSFACEIKNVDIENYLSLVYSYYSDMPVKFEDYKEYRAESKQTQPTLIFEKIDSNDSLYLKLVSSLPGHDINFFVDYDISRIVSLNEMEKKIIISDVVQGEIQTEIQKIKRSLTKHSKSIASSANNHFHKDENLFILEKNLAETFIHKELPGFLQTFTILGTDKLKSYKIRPVTPKLHISLSHGIDFLEGDASLEIEGENHSLFDLLKQYRKNSYITLGDGSHAIINQTYLNKLERLFKKNDDKIKISFFDLPEVEELIGKKAAEKTFPQSRKIFLGFNQLKKEKIKTPALKTKLRPYQKDGFKWLNYLHTHSLGGCLADDMGLGKTIQAITMLSLVYPKMKMPSLIVMPKSLLFNWKHEIKKFSPKLSTYTYYASNRDMTEAKKHQIILTTYGIVRNDIKIFKKENFYYLILDESQNIKNIHAQTTKAVMLLTGKHRLAISGTPIENNLGELYSLFHFLNPVMLGSQDNFNANYSGPIQLNNDKEAMSELRRKIYPFILRRLKKDVLKDLPDKIEQTLTVEMNSEQKKLYDQRRAFYYNSIKGQISKIGINKSQFFILQAFSELRQIASIPEAKSDGEIISPKRELLSDYIMDAVSNNHKVLVFANFISIIEHVALDLEKEGIEFLTMTGATRNREKLVEQFQNDPETKVFIMTLKTGGVGLNLTAADRIFIFDPWWNVAAENQAIDRTHRIGQDKTVFSYKLITQNTIEEKILMLQEKKKKLFDNIISSDNATIKSLSENDVEFILG